MGDELVLDDAVPEVDEVEDNFVDMSDEDFEKLSGAEQFENAEPIKELEEPVEEEPIDDVNSDADDEGVTPENAPTDDEEEAEPAAEEGAEVPDKDLEAGTETEEKAEAELDYEALYKEIMAPFKADGEEFTPKTPEDLKRLAQMGVNYHGKMAGMKPARKALLTLQNNGLLDDGKLDFLIDISKGNPEAIAKLLKDQNIDPLEVDVKAESTYVPEDYSATEEQVNLDEVLKTIENTPSYKRTEQILTSTWDQKSQTEAATNPNIISIINEQVDSGVYDTVMKEVKYQQSLGNLVGVSTFDAYKQAGDDLAAAGKLNGPATSEKKAAPVIKAKVVDPTVEAKRLANKKSAKMTKTSIPKKKGVPAGFNPLDLSDEDFAKFDPTKLGIK